MASLSCAALTVGLAVAGSSGRAQRTNLSLELSLLRLKLSDGADEFALVILGGGRARSCHSLRSFLDAFDLFLMRLLEGDDALLKRNLSVAQSVVQLRRADTRRRACIRSYRRIERAELVFEFSFLIAAERAASTNSLSTPEEDA